MLNSMVVWLVSQANHSLSQIPAPDVMTAALSSEVLGVSASFFQVPQMTTKAPSWCKLHPQAPRVSVQSASKIIHFKILQHVQSRPLDRGMNCAQNHPPEDLTTRKCVALDHPLDKHQTSCSCMQDHSSQWSRTHSPQDIAFVNQSRKS